MQYALVVALPRWTILFAAVLILNLVQAETIESDICIYGGTVAGVAAGVQASRMGKSVVITEFGSHLGGMTSGGLGATDIGNKAAIGGIAREFYHRVAAHYARDEAWQFESSADYFKNHHPREATTNLAAPDATMWTFEPHVAEDILFDMVNEARVPIYLKQRLVGVEKEANRITAIRMENGKVFRAKVFIDASYEGDLMAGAHVNYTVGREANAQYSETLDGIRAVTPKHQFMVAVDPYVSNGVPSSGLVKQIQSVDPGEAGSGDASVQAYNFRLCYTRIPQNRLPNLRPHDYNPADYELLGRYLEALVAAGKNPVLDQLWNPIYMPNGKTDINNNGGFSTDFIGENYDYPNASFNRRAEIWRAHEDYIKGFVYFLSTSPRVPENIRKEMQGWGPAKDEFLDTGHWPHQLYVREARRMIADYVMTEANCRGKMKAQDPAGLAAYTMDSHNCRRIVRGGHVENEGDVQVGGFPPYPISYKSIVPKESECGNLLVPVCLSATHISYGSIRMEPVFMILGQTAATASSMAIDNKKAVQRISYPELRKRLESDGQILEWKPRALKTSQRK